MLCFADELYYCEPLDFKDKDTKLAVARYLIMNFDDLDGLNQKDIGQLKAFISAPKVTKRVSYGRTDEHFDRIASMFATTNKTDFLIDENNTRWIILDVDDFEWKNLEHGYKS